MFYIRYVTVAFDFHQVHLAFRDILMVIDLFNYYQKEQPNHITPQAVSK